MAELTGYKGLAHKVLTQAGANIGDVVQIHRDGKTYEGILIPRSEYSDDLHILIKLNNGYNAGIRLDSGTKVTKLGEGSRPAFIRPPRPKERGDLPKLAIISTGGTIACRVDYRSGAVQPALSADDLYSVFPELSEIARIDTEILYQVFSEDLTPTHWSRLAEAVARHIEGGAQGVVITHGTDTMAYSAAALSFALQNLPVPVILVGSQRSSDRPSSDAASNLLGAVIIASKAPFAEVCVSMHAGTSDDILFVHRGTKVRKCHTSSRDAFKSINSEPLAKYDTSSGDLEVIAKDYRQRDERRRLELKPQFNEKAALVKFWPGMDPSVCKWYVNNGYRGIVLEGTGLGHVSKSFQDYLNKFAAEGIFVGMTSQCLWGRVNMNVYYTGRDLQGVGVIPLEDMLPETALVKLMWALSQTNDVGKVKEMMLTNFANEINPKTLPSE